MRIFFISSFICKFITPIFHIIDKKRNDYGNKCFSQILYKKKFANNDGSTLFILNHLNVMSYFGCRSIIFACAIVDRQVALAVLLFTIYRFKQARRNFHVKNYLKNIPLKTFI